MLFIFVPACALSFILRSFQRRHSSSVMPTVIPSAPTVIPSAASVSPIARTSVMPDLIGHLPVILSVPSVILSEAKDLFTLHVIPSEASVSHLGIIHKSITK